MITLLIVTSLLISFFKPFVGINLVLIFIGFSYTNVPLSNQLFPVLSGEQAGNIASAAGIGGLSRIAFLIVTKRAVLKMLKNKVLFFAILFFLCCILSSVQNGGPDSVGMIKGYSLVFTLFVYISLVVNDVIRLHFFYKTFIFCGIFFSFYNMFIFVFLPDFSQNASTPILFPVMVIFLIQYFQSNKLRSKVWNILLFSLVLVASSLIAVRRPFIGILFVVFMYMLGRGDSKKMLIKSIMTNMVFMVFIFGVVQFVVNNFMPEKTREKLINIKAPNYRTGSGRIFIWSAGFQMFLDNPIFGVGPGNFRHRLPEYMKADEYQDVIVELLQLQRTPETHRQAAHNMFLGTLAELGLVGFTLFMLILIFSIKNYWEMAKYCGLLGGKYKVFEVKNFRYAFYGWLLIMILSGTLPLEKYLWFYISFASTGHWVLKEYWKKKVAMPVQQKPKRAPSVFPGHPLPRYT